MNSEMMKRIFTIISAVISTFCCRSRQSSMCHSVQRNVIPF